MQRETIGLAPVRVEDVDRSTGTPDPLPSGEHQRSTVVTLPCPKAAGIEEDATMRLRKGVAIAAMLSLYLPALTWAQGGQQQQKSQQGQQQGLDQTTQRSLMTAQQQKGPQQADKDQIRLAMALLHECLSQSDGLAHVDFAQYLHTLVSHLFQTYGVAPGVRLQLQADPLAVGLDTALCCGLVLNELFANALKYASPEGQSGAVLIMLKVEPEGHAILCIRTTGVGVPAGLDGRATTSLSSQLVRALAERFQGTLVLERRRSVALALTFPIGGEEPRAAGITAPTMKFEKRGHHHDAP
jgi:two-component sensor histidine kinase